MKGFPAAVFLAVVSTAPAWADGANEVSFRAGKMSLNMGKAGAGGGQVTMAGVSCGVRFLHPVGSFAGIGLDADFLKPRDKTTGSLIANGQASTSIDSASLLGIVRLGPDDGALRPHFLLGFGIHLTSMNLEAVPNPGYGWIDTGTGEKRTLIDSQATGPSFKVEGGVDYALSDGFLAGVYLAVNYLGSAEYEATSQAKSLGLNSAKGSMSAISGGAALTARF